MTREIGYPYIPTMIKKDIHGDSLAERLKSKAEDRLYRFTLEDRGLRGAICRTTGMVNEMRANHDLGIMETFILGHAYIAASLLTLNLKGGDRVSIKLECSGPAQGLAVEANAFGEVRGYLAVNPIPVEAPVERFDMAPFIGAGFLTVTKHLGKGSRPFTSRISLEYGTIAEDLARFFVLSEQTPTALVISVNFDGRGVVTGAGGLIVQAMPEAEEGLLAGVQDTVRAMPSIGAAFADGTDTEKFLMKHLGEHRPEVLESRRIEFMCHCSRERFLRFIRALSLEELEDMAENGPFPLVTRCHNCNTAYEFDRDEIRSIFEEARLTHRSRN